MKLLYNHIAKLAISLNFSPTSSHLYPLQVENCDSNSRLVVDKDDNGKFGPERVKARITYFNPSSAGIMTFKVDPLTDRGK